MLLKAGPVPPVVLAILSPAGLVPVAPALRHPLAVHVHVVKDEGIAIAGLLRLRQRNRGEPDVPLRGVDVARGRRTTGDPDPELLVG